MSLKAKQVIIAILAFTFLASLIFVQWMEVARKQEEVGLKTKHVSIPDSSRSCIECHQKLTPGIIDHWIGSTHAEKGVGCIECHQADKKDADAFDHEGWTIATIVTPRDCSKCHKKEYDEFENSHHASAGNILASLDNFLAETVEGSREPFKPFNPHSPTMGVTEVDGMASVNVGCKQCHGSKVTLEAKSGAPITLDDLKPGPDGKPTTRKHLTELRSRTKGNLSLTPPVGQTRASAASILMARLVRVQPATRVTIFPPVGLASQRTAGNATLVLTTRRKRSTKNQSTVWRFAT
jgi:hypothetical protein